MAGQIVRRGEKTWLVRAPLGRASDGRRLYHNKTVHGSKKEAQAYLTRVLRELDTHTFVQASSRSVSSYLDEWLSDSAARRVRPKTLMDYRALLSRHIIPALGHRKLKDLTTLEISGVYTEMLKRGLSGRTVRYLHAVLRSALEEAVAWRMIASNPAKLVSLPKHHRREMRALSAAEASRFLQLAEQDRWYAFWLLLLTTGLRPAEALGLKWSDLTENRLSVQRSLVRLADGHWHVSEPKTSKARRIVTLPDSAVKVLAWHRAQQAAERLKAGADWLAYDFIFCNRAGAPLDYRVVIRRHFKPLARQLGIPSLRPYDLRHTCATLLLAAGENVKVVSERLGHSTATLTLDVYSHVLPDMQQRACEKLEKLLFSSI